MRFFDRRDELNADRLALAFAHKPLRMLKGNDATTMNRIEAREKHVGDLTGGDARTLGESRQQCLRGQRWINKNLDLARDDE